MDNKKTVQQQFGGQQTIHGYATSTVHAHGQSLQRLACFIQPQPTWYVLDVATGAGHTAHLFAPRVSQVIATDITPGMLAKAAELAARLGLTNVQTRLADAESLPFDDNTFDLLTCRLAFHHFPQSQQVLAEFARVLKSGGTLGFTDNIVVPDKKAAAYYNAYERLRDPSHHWVYPLPRLRKMMAAAGLTVITIDQLSKEFEFHKWADRQNVSPANREKLLLLMRNIPAALKLLFAPRWEDDTMYFNLWEAVIIAQK